MQAYATYKTNKHTKHAGSTWTRRHTRRGTDRLISSESGSCFPSWFLTVSIFHWKTSLRCLLIITIIVIVIIITTIVIVIIITIIIIITTVIAIIIAIIPSLLSTYYLSISSSHTHDDWRKQPGKSYDVYSYVMIMRIIVIIINHHHHRRRHHRRHHPLSSFNLLSLHLVISHARRLTEATREVLRRVLVCYDNEDDCYHY